jgi:hypothetical protein
MRNGYSAPYLDSNLLKLKQPKKLQELVMLRVVKMITWWMWVMDKSIGWDSRDWQWCISEGDTERDIWLPHGWRTSNILTEKHFRTTSSSFNKKKYQWNYNTWWELLCIKERFLVQRRGSQHLAWKMLRAVLPTLTYAYYTKVMSSSFPQKIIIRTLDCVRKLTVLTFIYKPKSITRPYCQVTSISSEIWSHIIHQWLYSPLLITGSFLRFLMLYTVCRNPWAEDQPVARPVPTHRTAQTHNKRKQISMHRVGFEPTISAFERAKTVHALDSAATLISKSVIQI